MERSNSITVYRNGAQVPAQRPQALPIVATPVADILETDTAFFIRIDLPGASRDSIRVSVQRGVLAITADLREPDVAPRRTIHREILWNQYERRFNLGRGIDEERITAEALHGVLTVRVPKADAFRAREIPVR
ncbi:MAG: Hsp20/alpha crystallin family protein [Bacteroidetes bacterium]|jgi:HSP20 family protein|nr:Hsp20/alpha crystallin family protein [Bacteroidota bacterium]